ncbi:MAG: RsmB/NOP family class I SAM-dependent RNA methyltransferase, partial [Chlamydiota bacterium]
MIPFREYHLFLILQEYESQHKPIDAVLSIYFRSNKSIGSKDRKYISDTLYALMRWRGLLDFLIKDKGPITWEKRLAVYKEQFQPQKYENDVSIPPHIRASFPKIYFDKIKASLGEEKAWDFCLTSNTQAPLTIRVNRLKKTREELLALLKEKHFVFPCAHAPNGISFQKKINIYDLPEFHEGYFEIQDEGSQLISSLVEPKNGDSILDFCAGAGGKTLAIAPLLEGKGQIFLHDIRGWILQEAKKRLRRAGIQNAQIVLPEELKQKNLEKKMDFVLLDVPCSGSGTLRRNPGMKWHFQEAQFQDLLHSQKEIFEKSLSFVKPGGKIVYITCSIFREENESQIEYFTQHYPVSL